MAAGLALYAVTQVDNATRGTVAVWAFALLISGAGIGMAWPHLSAWAMEVADESEKDGAAAAAINTVQLISGAYAGGLAGVVVNASGGSDAEPGPLAVRIVRRLWRRWHTGLLPRRPKTAGTGQRTDLTTWAR